MNYQWLIVAGLISDIIGFGILAWDLLPEYRLYVLEKRADFSHRNAADSAGRPPPEAPGLRAAEQAIRILRVGDVERVRRSLHLRASKFAGRTENISPVDVAKSRLEVETALAARRASLGGRYRPPIGLGAGLVFLGFILQIVGSWPR